MCRLLRHHRRFDAQARSFKALLVYPFTAKLPAARILYVWVHAASILAAAALALRAFFNRRSSPLAMLSTTWLLLNTAFILCLGSLWGFQCFHRFSIPAAPATWFFLRRGLPSGRLAWFWLPIAGISAIVAAVAIISEAPGW